LTQVRDTVAPVPAETIVVVDDDKDSVETLAMALTLDGFDVRTAHDGASALEAIAACTPLCVLTDVQMPGIDGIHLARQLRATFGPELVLIAATGFGDPDDRTTAQFSDFDICLRKPIDLDKLRKILRSG